MRHQNRSRHIMAETDQQGLIGRIFFAIDGDVILQLTRHRLYRQGRLPGTVFPAEIHRDIIILRWETTVMQLHDGIFRKFFQGHDLILLHPTPRQFLLVTLPIHYYGHTLGMRRSSHTLIYTQYQRDDYR